MWPSDCWVTAYVALEQKSLETPALSDHVASARKHRTLFLQNENWEAAKLFDFKQVARYGWVITICRWRRRQAPCKRVKSRAWGMMVTWDTFLLVREQACSQVLTLGSKYICRGVKFCFCYASTNIFLDNKIRETLARNSPVAMGLWENRPVRWSSLIVPCSLGLG